MSKIVDVAAAVLLRAEGREYLLAQRPPGKVYAGYWEFPGGKVEPGESVEAALRRELQEELGIEVQPVIPGCAASSPIRTPRCVCISGGDGLAG